MPAAAKQALLVGACAAVQTGRDEREALAGKSPGSQSSSRDDTLLNETVACLCAGGDEAAIIKHLHHSGQNHPFPPHYLALFLLMLICSCLFNPNALSSHL